MKLAYNTKVMNKNHMSKAKWTKIKDKEFLQQPSGFVFECNFCNFKKKIV